MTHHPDLQAIRAKLRSLQEDDVLPPVIEPDWQTPQQRLAERAATDATEFSFALASNVESAEQTLAHQQASAIAALQRRSKQGQSLTNGMANGFSNGQDDRQTSPHVNVQPNDQNPMLQADVSNAAREQTIAEAVAQHTAWEKSESANAAHAWDETERSATQPVQPAQPTQSTQSAQSIPAQSSAERSYVSTDAVTNPVAAPPDPAQAAAQRWQQSYQKIQLQIQQINQLAQTQETAIRDLRILSEVAAHWQRIVAEDQGVPSHQVVLPFCWSKQPLGVPVIQQNERGQWLVQTRFIDLLQAEREAEVMATQLRHRQLRSRSPRTTPPLGLRLLRCLRWLQQQVQQWWQQWSKQLGFAPSPRRAARASSRASGFPASTSPATSAHAVREPSVQPQQPAYQPQWSNSANTQPFGPPPKSSSAFQMPDFSLLDISIWITGAAIARVGLDWMLANLPFTAPAVIGLILVMTGWAVYRATTDSELTLTLGYRALLLMIGLLLGGTL